MKKISRRSFLTAMAAVSAAGVLAACGASSSTASSVASSVAASSETAASSEAAPESVTIKAFNGAKELVDVEVPFDPQRIAILELASLDILDELGVGDRVVGTASTSLDYLQSYVTNDSIANLGNIKEADMEAVMACEPDIIFIGGRLSKSYDALCEIAPVVFLSTDAEKGVVESTRENAMTIASIFGLEDQVESLMADFDSRIDALKAFAEGKTAIVGMTTSGSFRLHLCDGPRCSHWHRWRTAGTGDPGKRAGGKHRCLQERPHRLSGTPECLVHRRGRHSGTERNAERSGKRTAVIFSKFFLQF